MKIRFGFVSNSSSASYIIDLKAFNSVYELAKAMIELVIQDYKQNFPDIGTAHAEKSLKNLEQAVKKGLNPDTPVHFPTINFDTQIVKMKDGYHVDTSMNHPFWELKGILEADEYLPNFPKDIFFFLSEFDVIGQLKSYDPKYKCKNEHHPQMIILENGEAFCPQCNPEKCNKKLANKW